MNDSLITFLPLIAGLITFAVSYLTYSLRDKKFYEKFSFNLRGNMLLLEYSNAFYTKRRAKSWLKTLLLRFKMKKVI